MTASHQQSEQIHPFRCEISEAVLQDLRARLAATRFPDQVEDAGWDYGSELTYVQELCAYWRDQFDWRQAEARFNAHPQFTTEIEGEHLHFYHVRSPEPDAAPLIITHGYPGSVAEFLDILGPLSNPAAHGGSPREAFHVVAPSIPGYGFSGPTRRRGFDLYYESLGPGRLLGESSPRIETPTGHARFPAEIRPTPRAWAEQMYNVVRWTEMPKGGHFAALEQPQLFVDEVRSFFRDYR